jgi:competence protein ComK
MNKYIITDSTLVLFSLGTKTQVYEKYTNYIIDKDLYTLIDDNCKYYGSSLKGRCEATEFLTGIKYKCPIILSESKHLIFFPTSSYKNEKCVWFNYYGIDHYFMNENMLLTVYLKNNKKIELDISNNVINNQILKASRLESIFRNNR